MFQLRSPCLGLHSLQRGVFGVCQPEGNLSWFLCAVGFEELSAVSLQESDPLEVGQKGF